MPLDSTTARVAALLPLAPRDYLILFSLASGPLHGHGILKFMEAESHGVMFDPANLYRSLRKLERDELVVEAQTGGASAGPARRSYRLTTLGRAVLSAEAQRLTRLADLARARKLVPARESGR
jgi:DNA-binding PadR family transcriptional regulator